MIKTPQLHSYTLESKSQHRTFRLITKSIIALVIFSTIVGGVIAKQKALADNPIAITDCQGLQDINENLAADYVLLNDIDCTGFEGFTPIGDVENPFTGNFDGNHKTISDLTVDSDNFLVGLFGVADSSTFQDLTISSFTVTGNGLINGGLVGGLTNGVISNVQLNDGLVLTNSYGDAPWMTGGLIGAVSGDIQISQSSFSGDVRTEGDQSGLSGGLIGVAGLFVEAGDVSITDSYSEGSVVASNYAGGLVGFFQTGNLSIQNSYSSSAINYNVAESAIGIAGGLIGGAADTTITIGDSFYASEGNIDSSFPHSGGIVGSLSDVTFTSDNNYYYYLEGSDMACANVSTVVDEETIYTPTEYEGCFPEETIEHFRGSDVNEREPMSNWDFSTIWYATPGIAQEFPTFQRYYPYYTISNCQELQNMNNDLEGYYTLQNDIDCQGFDFTPIAANGFTEGFTGVLDGGTHTISNLVIDGSEDEVNLAALISYVGEAGATVKNINLENLEVTGHNCASSLVGYSDGGIILDKVNSEGVIVGLVPGECFNAGLLGTVEGSLFIQRTSFTGSITGNIGGGLVGNYMGTSFTIVNSYTQGTIIAGNGAGLITIFTSEPEGSISNSYSAMDIISTPSEFSTNIFNGFFQGFGQSNVVVSNSFYAGTITRSDGTQFAGIGTLSELNGTYDNLYYYQPEGSDIPCGNLGNDDDGYEPVEIDGCSPIADQSYFKGSDVATRAPMLNQWDFDDIWVANASTYPAFEAVSGEAEQEHNSSSSGSPAKNQTINENAVVPGLAANYCIGSSDTDSCVTKDEYIPGVTNLRSNNSSLENLVQPTLAFLRNLGLKMTGVDVKALQQFLNQNNFTVSDSGAGSKGNETNYYGEKTRSAITRFQEYYMTQILTPLGLTKGTGYFGDSTRGFVNSLLK